MTSKHFALAQALLAADPALDAISAIGKRIRDVRAAIEGDHHVWASFLSPSGDAA